MAAGVPHAFRNAGDGPMTILWVYPSQHVTRTFMDTGETAGHLSAAGPDGVRLRRAGPGLS